METPCYGSSAGFDRLTRRIAKAVAIDAAVFDLKAVNPNAVMKTDDRTPDEVIRSIEDQGNSVTEALSRLRKLLPSENGKPTTMNALSGV